MKLNKKGMTLVELIISVALLSVVLGFMFKLLLDVKYEHDNAGFAIKNQVNRADIIKTIQNDFEELGLLSYSEVSTKKLNFTFNNTNKTLEIKNGSVLKYGGKKWTIKDEGYKFGDIKVNAINSEYITIVIPVSSGAEDNTDIDNIMLVTKYKTLEKPYLNDAILSHAKDNNYMKGSMPVFDINFRDKIQESGLFKTRDDYGISYFYRGNINSNYVKFGKDVSGNDIYWRIMRINGDGTVRLIYDGNSLVGNGVNEDAHIGWSKYNDEDAEKKYSGYTYEEGGTRKDSALKTIIDNWYKTNLLNDYSQYLADSVFCNDLTLDSNAVNTFASHDRIFNMTMDSLICSRKEDRYTVDDTNYGNGLLTYPIATISAEDAIFAGSTTIHTYAIENFYMNRVSIWTMTPSHAWGATDKATMWILSSAGNVSGWMQNMDGSWLIYLTTKGMMVRPVINLRKDLKVAQGDGTIDNPYVLEEVGH